VSVQNSETVHDQSLKWYNLYDAQTGRAEARFVSEWAVPVDFLPPFFRVGENLYLKLGEPLALKLLPYVELRSNNGCYLAGQIWVHSPGEEREPYYDHPELWRPPNSYNPVETYVWIDACSTPARVATIADPEIEAVSPDATGLWILHYTRSSNEKPKRQYFRAVFPEQGPQGK
jgi:hypothetical protein